MIEWRAGVFVDGLPKHPYGYRTREALMALVQEVAYLSSEVSEAADIHGTWHLPARDGGDVEVRVIGVRKRTVRESTHAHERRRARRARRKARGL